MNSEQIIILLMSVFWMLVLFTVIEKGGKNRSLDLKERKTVVPEYRHSYY